MRVVPISLLVAIVFAAPSSAQHQHTASPSPYAGQESREIAALSSDDVAELRAGGGWGFALPAELNGVPGPTHLLELSDELNLSSSQIEALTELRDKMRADAIRLGEDFIEAERALNAAFVRSVPDQQTLGRLILAAEEARAALRQVHLEAHLVTPGIVSQDQVEQYIALRGYAVDPCTSVPDGHNATLWRQHNGCQ